MSEAEVKGMIEAKKYLDDVISVRIPTEQEILVLFLLANGEEDFAWSLVRRAKLLEKSLSENSIYVVMMRMVARGLVSDREESLEEKTGRGKPKRLYKITKYGKDMLRLWKLIQDISKKHELGM